MLYDKLIKKTCFFISDDLSDQAEFAQALGDTMPDTVCFAIDDAFDAFSLIQQEKVIPNFIFVELAMPDMSGLEFLRSLKKIDRFKHIPVVVHTPNPDQETVNELKESGVFAIYVKPYNYFGLRALLNLYFRNVLFVASQN